MEDEGNILFYFFYYLQRRFMLLLILSWNYEHAGCFPVAGFFFICIWAQTLWQVCELCQNLYLLPSYVTLKLCHRRVFYPYKTNSNWNFFFDKRSNNKQNQNRNRKSFHKNKMSSHNSNVGSCNADSSSSCQKRSSF